MISLSVKDLEQQDISIRGKSEFVFQNKFYKRKTTISKKIDNILEIIEQYQSDELEIIVIEHSFYFSIWLETKLAKDSKEDLDDFVNQKLKDLGF